MTKCRVILDTNIFISYLLRPNPPLSEAIRAAFDRCIVLVSQDTFDELRSVTERFVKRRYVTVQEASEFLGSLVEVAEWVKILETVQACRDAKDDKFLELAINGQAHYLVTGDQDLLVLHPFREIPVLSVRDFLEALKKDGI